MEDRTYQGATVRKAEWAMRCGRRVLIVCPTGGGKTEMASMIIRRHPGSVGFLTHTKDLVEQTAERLREHGHDVGVVAAGYQASHAKVQVASVQTLVAREAELRCSLVILDEAHHFLAEEWRAAFERTGCRYLLGLTATPERGDGRPLGDIFDEMIVAAQYSELIAKGYLVPLRVLRPREELDRGLAQKVVESYLRSGEGRHGFAFVRSVLDAENLAHDARGVGIPSAVVEAETPKEQRASALARLGAELRLLFNVRALTEGVNIPSASICIYGKNFMHQGGVLQSAGRILRTAPGKKDALLLDLPGVTHRLGIPTEDKEYSLTGQGIKRSASAESLHVCMECGACYPSGPSACPRCGHVAPVQQKKPLRIYNKELEPVYAGSSTPDWAKRAELDRLRGVAKNRGLGLGWVRIEYEKLFGTKPVLGDAVGEEQRREFERLLELAKRQGHSTGWAQHRYRAVFGAFPPRTWVPA